MKKVSVALLTAVLAINVANAQEKNYNRWAVDLNGGLAKPARTLTPGFSAETFENLHLDGGVRYSLNNKFGVKGSFGYDKLDSWTNNQDVKAEYYRTSLEGVVNLGRILNFENWTSVLNVQAHAGGGYSWLRGSFDGTDNMGHLMAGLTGQIKLHKRVALNADFTVIQNTQQNQNWDGQSVTTKSVFQGTMFNATMGISIYLGKQAQHADWYSEESNTVNKLAELEDRLAAVEGKLVDTDGDGVADYLDQEPNTPAGAMVDTKGRAIIDANKNGIADNIENYFEQNFGGDKGTAAKADPNAIKDLINNGFVAVYFDFNKSQPSSVDGINFINTYMKQNPNATVEVIGYADAIGNKSYNDKLSEKRANTVKNILVKSGVSASRVSAKGKGMDTSASKDSDMARKTARKVLFLVK
ncbi:MAG: OmpA family protein [Flavobacteriaceae bacterium]|jgi:OOP family OmpA-OmpF porin|nr:OmpA family protein [Flavobacteriaceae bacterium]